MPYPPRRQRRVMVTRISPFVEERRAQRRHLQCPQGESESSEQAASRAGRCVLEERGSGDGRRRLYDISQVGVVNIWAGFASEFPNPRRIDTSFRLGPCTAAPA